MRSRAALRGIYFSIAALVIACDRISKILIRRYVELNFGSVPVVPHFFSLTHVENTGAAFSLFADWPPAVRRPLLVSFSIVALAVVCYLLWNEVRIPILDLRGLRCVSAQSDSARGFSWNGLALALILGGAVGNLYDRVLYGRVTDFLHCYIGTHSWPDFNLADSAIVVGTALLIVELLWGERARAH